MEEKQRRVVKSIIVGKMALYGKQQEEVAIKCRVSVRTLQNRMKNPESFTLSELSTLCEYLHIPDEELCKMIKKK